MQTIRHILKSGKYDTPRKKTYDRGTLRCENDTMIDYNTFTYLVIRRSTLIPISISQKYLVCYPKDEEVFAPL